MVSLLPAVSPVRADTAYYQRTFFDNSLTPDAYFYSSGFAGFPSSLELIGKRLPVETGRFVTPPNALRLHWTSQTGGGWTAEINLYQWRNRPVDFPGDTLRFWCYSPAALNAGELPLIVLQDVGRGFTSPMPLDGFVRGLEPGRWTQVSLPLNSFKQASVGPFDPHRVNSVRFVQNKADGHEHTLIIDEIRIDASTSTTADAPPAAPRSLKIEAFERHFDLSWEPGAGLQPERFIVYRSLSGGSFNPIGISERGVFRFADFVAKAGIGAAYKVQAQDQSYRASAFSSTVTATTHAMSDDDLLTMVQEAGFRYYWEAAHPVSGMTRENTPGNDDIVATGATGFGVMALIVGVDRGFITREAGVERLTRLTAFLKKADHFHGAWPHFMNGATGRSLPVFDMYDNGADLVETSFLMEGLLTARQYFNRNSDAEKSLHNAITGLWEKVEWDWFRRTPDGAALYWHWSPEYTWRINHPLYGWNEVMIAYLLAIASPTHGVPESLYYTGWAGDPPEFINGKTYFGVHLDLGIGTGGPLFFTHYSYMGFDPHGFQDKFTEYFEQNRKMATINHAYCVSNPGLHHDYGEHDWGITAADGPDGYVPYEPTLRMDDGTIAPTGAVSSIPYTPDFSLAALKFFYRDMGDRLWGSYGFRDAFNLDQDWFSGITMGLNQAPMVVMIENYRTGLLWKSFGSNREIQQVRRAISTAMTR